MAQYGVRLSRVLMVVDGALKICHAADRLAEASQVPADVRGKGKESYGVT